MQVYCPCIISKCFYIINRIQPLTNQNLTAIYPANEEKSVLDKLLQSPTVFGVRICYIAGNPVLYSGICTVCFLIFMIPSNYKLVSIFVQSLNRPLKDFIEGRNFSTSESSYFRRFI